MRIPPATMIRLLVPFAPLFSRRVWQNAQVLLMGAILTPGWRTVASALRVMGLDQHKRFHRYHWVLSHASWSSVKASHVLLGLLVEMFVPEGDPLIVASTRPWKDAGARRLLPKESTETRFVPLMKTS